MRARRLLAGTVVLASLGAGLALAAAGAGGVVPAPLVTVIRPPANTAGSASVTLTNTGSAAVTIVELVPDGTCDPGVTTASVAALPLALGPSTSRAVTVACAPTADTSIRRCQFHARTGLHADLADYTALCISPGQFALTLAPAAGLAFGEVALGAQKTLSVTITNNGAAAVTAESIHVADQAGDFELGAPCPTDGPACDAREAIASGDALTFDLRCSPTQLGARTTQLYVVTTSGGTAGPDSVTCTGVAGGAGPSLSLDRPSVDVGGVVVGSGSGSGTVSATLHAKNIGASDLHITAIGITSGASSDWAVTASSPCAQAPCTLAAGAAIALEVTFDPSALAGRHSTLVIRADDASHPTSVVTLDGTGLGATLALVSPDGSDGGDLGSVAVGGTTSLTLALRNDGNARLEPVTFGITQDDTAFAVDTSALSIGASSSVPFTLTCTPPAAIAYTGTLTITAATALSGSPVVIPLACTGTAGSVVATPSPLQLGEIRTGGGGVTLQTVTLTTLGPSVALTSGPTLATPLDGVTLGELSAPQVTAAVPVTFTLAVAPQHDGPLADHITLAAGAGTLDIPVRGAVVTAAVAPSGDRDLGSFCVGEPTATVGVSLAATGTASIGLTSPPQMALGDASPFQLTPVLPSVFPFSLPAGARATAQVTAKRESTAGVLADDVVWADDVGPEPSPHTTVTATFIDDGGAISPGAADFGTAPIHLLQPTDQIITVQNCGTEAMTLGAATITPSGAFYTIGALPPQLLPAQAATFSVGFGPVAVGDFSSTLSIPATKGAQMFALAVVLRGTGALDEPAGSADGGIGPGPGSSGCGCHTGGGEPAGGLLVAACALALRRRRRPVNGSLSPRALR